METQDNEKTLTPPVVAFSDDGVDISLIRWMLSLSPAERLEQLEDHAAFMADLRNARESVQISSDTRSAR